MRVPLSWLAAHVDGLGAHADAAALAGAAVVVSGTVLELPFGLVTGAGLILCFGLRFIAIRRGWHLPTAPWPDDAGRVVAAPHDRWGETRDGELDKPDEK